MSSLKKWKRVIKEDRDFDYTYLFKIMEFKLSMMEEEIRHGGFVDSEKTAEKVRIAKLLCRRLGDEEYDLSKEKYMRNQDLEYLFLILKKHVGRWWT